MNIQHCNAIHQCADGGRGECSSIAGHYGRHVCSRCLTPFTTEQAEARAQAPPTLSGAGAGERIAGKATEYACAHCGKNYAIEDNRCIYCDNLICQSCNSANCPRVSLKCAHCGKGIPTISYTYCKYCGYRICDICPPEGCPKPAMVCPHCSRPIPKDDYALCYCGSEIHPQCLVKCPQKPPQSKAGITQPPRRMRIPKSLAHAVSRPIMGYTCVHCGRGFQSLDESWLCYCGEPAHKDCLEKCPSLSKGPTCCHCGQRITANQERWLCWCNDVAHKECLDKCPSRPKGPKCCHCGREITSDQERWLCWCNDVAHKECLDKCPSRPKEAAATGPAAARLRVPEIAAPADFLCAHCGNRYADDNIKCVYCDKLLCQDCRDTRCPRWH